MLKKILWLIFFMLNTNLALAGIITDTDLFTCNGTTCSLKYGMSLTGTVGSGLTIGGSTITGGTTTYLLYNNGGILGNLNPAGLTLAWSQITSTPTTVAGYGITDAFNSSSPTPIGSVAPNTGTFTTESATTNTSTATTSAKRYVTSGTSLSSGNFSLTAGSGGTWGVSSSVGSISGNDSGFSATVTTSGTPGLNPILTLTFADGGWPSAPFATCGSWITGTTLNSDIATSTTTTLALQFIGTPTTGTDYSITCSWIHGQ